MIYGESILDLQKKLADEIEWQKDKIQREKSEPISISINHISGTLSSEYYGDKAEVFLKIDIHNNSKRRTPEIDALYLHTGDGWVFTLDGTECPSTASDRDDYKQRHFLKAPVTRLGSGDWAQLKLSGAKTVWFKWDGDERQEEYRISGRSMLEVSTSEGNYSSQHNLDITVSEIPF